MTYSLLVSLSLTAYSAERFTWPNNAQAAISLAYDDALNSQLDHAIPALNRYQLHASFYLTLSAKTVTDRLAQWRKIALEGHELANHSLNHACRGSLPNRDWVTSDNDLDKKTVTELVREIQTANQFLYAIDNQEQRTLTLPCGDILAGGENYLNAVQHMFIGVKSHIGPLPKSMSTFNITNSPVWAPVGATGAELIAYVEQAAHYGTIANITFHGIGGDYLTVSKQAQEELLAYLAKHPKRFWVSTFKNISRYIQSTKIEN